MDDALVFLPVVAGPTASGKTALAVSLAKRINGEVVSADSMQIYRELRIGTASPTPEEMDGIAHHLIGFVPLEQEYSVARYVDDAKRTIFDIDARGRQPLLCGGTGLYIDAVIDNLNFTGAGRDDKLRQSLRRKAEEQGADALLSELYKIDEQTASKLHPNNLGRIIRALELYYTTGMTMSEHVKMSRSRPPLFNACMIVLDCRDRDFLYHRINKRVDNMISDGLVDEVRAVLSNAVSPTALQAIGYKEFIPYFEGELSLNQAVENLKRSTRRYAKRQLTWFRRRKTAHVLYIDELSATQSLCDAAMAILEECAHG